MSDAAVAAPVPKASPPKAAKAKPAKAAKVAKPSTHPSYQDMIRKAVETLKERGGSSRQAIQKYIQANYKTCDDKVSLAHLKLALKRGVANGSLKHVKGTGATGSFRLNDVIKAAGAKPKVAKVAKKPKTPKPAGEKKAAGTKAAKPKAAAAKPKKAAAAKPKKAVAEKKATAKPKVAKKPTTPKKAAKPAIKKAATPKAKKPAAKKAAPKK